MSLSIRNSYLSPTEYILGVHGLVTINTIPYEALPDELIVFCEIRHAFLNSI
jgi:hypothetical protein